MTFRGLFLSLASAGLLAAAAGSAQDLASAAGASSTALCDMEVSRAIDGINTFSLELYKRRATPGKNLLLSPASVSAAVGLAYRGAVGETAEELARTLHFGASPIDYLRINGHLLATMNISGEGRQLKAANAVWLQSNMPVKADFEADVARYAKTAFERVDFKSNPDAARGRINLWVEDATSGRVKNLLQPLNVRRNTSAVLVNALYWKARWAAPFDKAQTRDEPFKLGGGGKVVMPLMHRDATAFQIVERQGIKAIRLPYAGGEVSMVILLPDAARGLDRFERDLTTADFRAWLSDLRDAPARPTILALPKLRLDSRDDLSFDLAAMGAPTAFGDAADFSGMTTLPNTVDPDAHGIKIGQIIHQAMIETSEEGTEAAAATAVIDIFVSGSREMPHSPPPIMFRADHPFLFALVDYRTGMILFMGRYVTPETARP